MAVTLAGITLPEDIIWTNEFAGFGVGQVVTPTLTAALVVEEIAQTAGRPIELNTGQDSWVTRALVEQLVTLAETPLDNTTLAFDWHGTVYQVVFNHGSTGVEAQEVFPLAGSDHDGDHIYSLTIRLITG